MLRRCSYSQGLLKTCIVRRIASHGAGARIVMSYIGISVSTAEIHTGRGLICNCHRREAVVKQRRKVLCAPSDSTESCTARRQKQSNRGLYCLTDHSLTFKLLSVARLQYNWTLVSSHQRDNSTCFGSADPRFVRVLIPEVHRDLRS